MIEIADISRVNRTETSHLKDFQRKEIRAHVREIVNHLNRDEVSFQNAIILAVGTGIEFKQARDGVLDVGQIGTLILPLRAEGSRPAWIVDGQQRALALADTHNCGIPVPVAPTDPAKALRNALAYITPHCHWTAGQWENIGIAWNDLQNVARHVRLLIDQLLRIDAAVNLRSTE